MATIDEKVSKVLFGTFFFFFLVTIRIWYLSVICHEDHVRLAKKPAYRTIVEFPKRGTVRDRFNEPLAVNKIQYNASICYEGIRRIPRIQYKRVMQEETSGLFRKKKKLTAKKVRVYPRREYIGHLAKMLAEKLDLDATLLEDMVYSKAALFPNTPFVIKEDIDEATYYRLRILQKDFPGLEMQISSKRYYPRGKVAANILGYMGAINEREHLSIRSEIELLTSYLNDRKNGYPTPLPKGYKNTKDVQKRLFELKEKSYTINSKVGKSGIEGRFDRDLRGICGKKRYEVDIHGNYLRELPESYDATSGRRCILSISAEMQEYAEKLLMDSEIIRERRFANAGKRHDLISSPWIKGGAVVAMDPKTGEVISLASYPNFDPNDFAGKRNSNIEKWLELPSYIAKIWDGSRLLERDFDYPSLMLKPPSEKKLSWSTFLDHVLSKKSSVRSAIDNIGNLASAIYLQNCMETLLNLSGETDMHYLIDALFPPDQGNQLTFYDTPAVKREEIRNRLHEKTTLFSEIMGEIRHHFTHIAKNDDKILLLDLCRLACPNHLFDDALLTKTGEETLETYRSFNQAAISVQNEIRQIAAKVFHENEFVTWRSHYFDDFLKEKRTEEKKAKKSARPYLDYLTEVENELFTQFFDLNRWDLLACFLIDDAPIDPGDIRMPYFHAIIQYSLKHKSPDALRLKEHLGTLPRKLIIPYLKTMRGYNELNRPLWGRYYFPFKAGREAKECDLARSFYPTPGFGYCRSFAFRENAPLGSIFKLVIGYEAAKQHYLKARSNDNYFDLNPLTVVDQSPPYHEKLRPSSILGYTLTGKPIHRYYKGGRLPRGHLNIGRIDLESALERSSNLYFSLLAIDHVSHPKDLIDISSKLGFGRKTNIDLPFEAAGSIPKDIYDNHTSLYSFAIGQHSLIVTPLQTASMLSTFANGGKIFKPQIVKTIVNIEPSDDKKSLFEKPNFVYRDLLENVGIHFPLFTEAERKMEKPYIWQPKQKPIDQIYLPKKLHNYLMGGLYDVVNGSKGTARPEAIKTLWDDPILRSHYRQIRPYLAGKTSTAEIAYRPTLDRELLPVICKHIWFSGVSFKEAAVFDDPELVVIVYLRYADHGKEAAPIAAELIKKWREIQARESS